uniref:Reverse transcriptase domain-containing protein n=1 Tax=Oryzias latipes TaxID=8090 RepID=A0A3P9KC19_ORYLA
MTRATVELCSDLGLFDAWRICNPRTKDFTFFSRPHLSFSRIDFLFVSRSVLDRTRVCSINPCVLSDHSLVSMEFLPPYLDPLSRHWRLNPTLLNDPLFVKYLEDQWKLYISKNDLPEVSASTLWEAGKAYLRGSIISYTAAKKKKNLARQLELEQLIATLERDFKQSRAIVVLGKLDAARSALDQLLTENAQTAIFYAKHRLFDSGNKPGRLLARLAQGKNRSYVISSLKDKKNNLHYETKQISKILKEYFQELYSSEYQEAVSPPEDFLDHINLPTVSEQDRSDLCRPIKTQEVIEAIKSLKAGKAPGPDGFGADFYKKIAKHIAQPLLNMYLEAFRRDSLPPTLNLAHITLILKENRPPDLCTSYRPISLLGVDCKILSKILARRLEGVLPSLVKSDQTGFIKGRYSHSNVRRLLNVLQFSQNTNYRALAISLDAEKAFDRVEWEYLFKILDRFGLGSEFGRWVKLLYRAPAARILVNGSVSDMFPLGRGTRQGCPLSPLLFALALEPLAEAIRTNPKISGVKLGVTEYKISLYADDVLLFLTNPVTSIPVLTAIIGKFGQLSGYKINFDKSEALFLGDQKQWVPPLDFPFRRSSTGFTYLGIRVSANLAELYKLNFGPVLASVKRDLNRWFDLPLSWLGRISLIKMNILPRVLYPMQMLPLKINRKTFSELEKCLSKFIWHGKKPRLKIRTLQLPYERGGQALPNFLFYFWACHARIVSGWLHAFLHQGELAVDSWCSDPLSPLSLLFTDVVGLPVEVKNNNVMLTTIKVWHDIVTFCGRRKFSSAMQPLIKNKAFPPGISFSIYDQWYTKGLRFVSNLFEKGDFMSFRQIQSKYNIPQKHFFGFLQVRHFVKSSLTFPADQPILNSLENFLLKFNDDATTKRNFISLFHEQLMLLNPLSTGGTRILWSRDLGVELSSETWSKAFVAAKTVFTCNRLRENQYRILHRLQYTPQLLHRFNPQSPPLCIKCKTGLGTYYHCIWQCPLIIRFWKNIVTEVSCIFHKTIPLNPALFLLGVSVERPPLSGQEMVLLQKLLHLARRCILLQWIQGQPPSVTQWYREAFKVLPMERLSALLKGNSDAFYKLWKPLLDHLPGDLVNILYKGSPNVVL